MKRIYLTIFAAAICASALAQSYGTTMSYMNDAYTWAQNEYFGTARSMGMGNAVTAVGGDLGMVGINPAGSAVSSHSVVSVTPAISIASSNNQGLATADENTYLANGVNTSKARFIMPNVGFTINFNTGTITGLKRVVFGFFANTTQRYDDVALGSGTSNLGTSTIAGSLASGMTGVPSEEWSTLQDLAWKNDLVGKFPGHPEKLIGITESPLTDATAELSGPIQQRFNYDRRGNKTDYVLNLGFDISDFLFIGANLGMVTLDYRFSQRYQEIAQDADNFWTGFKNLSTGYSYDCRGTGIYGKFGLIATPFDGLRVGAAFETPTSFTINESYTNEVNAAYGKKVMNGSDNVSNVTSGLVTPMRFNLGLAYTIMDFALISADYEFTNYAQTRFRARHNSDIIWFDNINDQIKGIGTYGDECLKAAHNFRVGAEVKPVPWFAARAGFNYITDGTKFKDDAGNVLKADTKAFSLGLSYYTSRSFFMDLAFKYSMRPNANYQVYEDYDNRGNGDSYLDICGPVLQSKRKLMVVALTAGWRF